MQGWLGGTARRREDRAAGLDRLYERIGPWPMVGLILLACAAISNVNGLLNLVLMQLYLDFRLGDWLTVAGLTFVVINAGLLTAPALCWRRLRRLPDWLAAGSPPAGAPEVFRISLEMPRRLVPIGGGMIMLLAIPLVVELSKNSSVDAHPGIIFFGLLETVAAGALLTYLVLEHMLRPIARRALESSEEDLLPPASPVSLRRKLLIGLPIVNVMTGYVVASVAGEASNPETRLPLGVVSALGVSLTVSLILTAMLSRSLTEPVAELEAATGRVARGDLSRGVQPLTSDELGVLGGRFNRMLEGLRERETLQGDVARQAAELRESRARIVAASDAARRAVERDLHDGAQQRLMMVLLKLGQAVRALEDDPDRAAIVKDAREDLTQALAELRDLAHGIYPAVLESDGLPGALAEAARRTGVPVEVRAEGTARYRPDLEAAVYFCCLEALQNAGKHAGEHARVAVALHERDGALEFDVADDGQGFEPEANGSSSGLQNMADRIGALGGTVRVESSPGHGTCVIGRVPLESQGWH